MTLVRRAGGAADRRAVGHRPQDRQTPCRLRHHHGARARCHRSRALAAEFGPNTGPWLIRLANGRDRSPVVGTPYVARSRSRETTFQTNLEDWDDVRREVAALAAPGGAGRGRRAAAGHPRRGQGAARAVLHEYARPPAGRADRGRRGDRAGSTGRSGPVRGPPAGAAARGPGRVRPLRWRGPDGCRDAVGVGTPGTARHRSGEDAGRTDVVTLWGWEPPNGTTSVGGRPRPHRR